MAVIDSDPGRRQQAAPVQTVSALLPALPLAPDRPRAVHKPADRVFVPAFEHCRIHGRYQANQQDLRPDGRWVERWHTGCPGCIRDARVGRLLQRAGIPQRFQHRTLEGYQAEQPAQQRALALARRYATQFDEVLAKGTCLVFSGNRGTGKTHLACGIANAIMRCGYSALFASASELIRKVRSTWRKDSPLSEQAALEAFSAIDLLIIDEVGVQYGTEGEQIILFEVINRRYERLKPTIILTNLPLERPQDGQGGVRAMSLADYLGDRAVDRLREGGGRLVVFDWPSWRDRV